MPGGSAVSDRSIPDGVTIEGGDDETFLDLVGVTSEGDDD
jgi:hypothetical protein